MDLPRVHARGTISTAGNVSGDDDDSEEGKMVHPSARVSSSFVPGITVIGVLLAWPAAGSEI